MSCIFGFFNVVTTTIAVETSLRSLLVLYLALFAASTFLIFPKLMDDRELAIIYTVVGFSRVPPSGQVSALVSPVSRASPSPTSTRRARST